MRQEPIEAYGYLSPADPEALRVLCAVLEDWGLAGDPALPPVTLEGDLLRVQFQGVEFPLDEVAEALRPYLCPDSEGRIDRIDREAWTLTRARFQGRELAFTSAGLNHILDFAGH